MPAAVPMIIGAMASSAALGTVIGGITIGTFGAAVIGGVASMAASAAMSYAMAPNAAQLPAQFNGAGAGRTQAVRQPITAHRIIYGTVKASGPIVFAYTTADDGGTANGYLYMAHVLAAHECDAVGDIYIGDVLSTDPSFTGLIRLTPHLGSPTQTADSDWFAEIPTVWGASHRLQGRTYIASRIKYNLAAFPSGVPNISALIRGSNGIYDPRTGLSGWSENAALCIANYITSPMGLNIPWNFIDSATLIESANICDEGIPVASGGPDIKRYTCNGVVSLDTAPRDVLAQMLTSMSGMIVVIGGQWFIHAGAATLGHTLLTEDDLRGDMITVPLKAMRDRMNGVRATYVDPDQNWQPVDAPPRMDSSYLAADGGVELTRDLQFPYTTNLPTVQRLMKIELEKNRRERIVQFQGKMTPMRLRPMSGVVLSIARYSWFDEMKVIGWSLAEGGGVDLTMQADDANIWSWSPTDEITPTAGQAITIGNPRVPLNGNAEFLLNTADSSLPNSRTIAAGTGLTLTDAGAGGTLTVAPATGGITSAMLRDSAGVSVIGRAANSSGAPADIAAGSDGHVLRRSSGVLGFGLIDLTASVTGLLPLANGGSNANLTASLGGIIHSTATAMAVLAGTVTANKPLMSGASAAPSWATPAYPNASATAGKIIRSDGTNYAASTLTVPDTITANQLLYASGSNVLGGSANLTFNGTDLTCGGSITESARAAAMGYWVTPTFAAGNFTGSGAMTWTVDAGDVSSYEYSLVGKTLHVNFYLVTTTVGGTPGGYLKLNLFGFTVAKAVTNRYGAYQGGWVTAAMEGRAGETFLRLYNDSTEGGTWGASTNGTYVKGTIALEIS